MAFSNMVKTEPAELSEDVSKINFVARRIIIAINVKEAIKAKDFATVLGFIETNLVVVIEDFAVIRLSKTSAKRFKKAEDYSKQITRDSKVSSTNSKLKDYNKDFAAMSVAGSVTRCLKDI